MKPERREEFLTTIKADRDGTVQDEEGSLQFLVIQDVANEVRK